MENSIKNSKHIAKSAVITGFATNKTADEKLKRNSKLRVAQPQHSLLQRRPRRHTRLHRGGVKICRRERF